MHTPAVLGQFDVKLDRLERRLPHKGRLLDFGCGAGYFLERAQQRGWDAHGVELGQWAGEAARRRGVPNLHTARLQDMAFPDGHFDAVNASQVFEHLTRPLPELAEIRRVLKPGGVFLIDVPNYHTLPILLNADDFMLNAPPQHVAFYTPRTLRKLLTAGGLTVDRVFSSSGLKWENLLGKPAVTSSSPASTRLSGCESTFENRSPHPLVCDSTRARCHHTHPIRSRGT
jgi:SAM-dependent methyltransferase